MKRAAGALLIAVALYSLLGFLIVPGIGLRIANQQLAQYSNAPARLERLQLNPFSLEATLWGLHIGEPGQEQVAFERLHANLQLDSLWRGVLHLSAVELDKPHTQLLFAKDGTLNLTQLFKLPTRAEPVTEEPPSKPFPLRIAYIKLADGNLRFEDLRPSDPIEFVYDDLSFELHNLSTLPDDSAEMTLVATGPRGGRIDWNGQISLVPISSSGNLKISDGKLKALWPYVRDAVPLVLEEGVIDLATDYSLSLANSTQLLLHNTQVKIAPFAIKAPDGRPLVKLANLEISDTRLDLLKQQVVVGKIRSQQLETWAAREADGQLDWQKLFATATASSAQQESKKQTEAAPGKPWQVLLRDVQLRDYRVHLADRVPEQDVALELGPLDLDLQDFDSLGTSPFTLKLDTGLGKQGTLQVEGQAQLNPTTASLKVASRAIDLRLAQAYLSPLVRIELRSGLLDSELDVALDATEPLAFSVTGKAQVNQLHTLDTLKERDFVRWQQLDLLGLNYRHGDSLSIDKVQLNQPYARFIINEDLTTNVGDLLITRSGAPGSGDPAPAASTQPTEPAPASPPLGIHIGEVTFTDGSANFADFSLTPNFATAIQQLNGRIGTLDSRAQKPASVDIAGKIDRYAPVSVKGSLNPFDPMDSLDIITQFKQVELTTLTPYSGKFAGYRIRKGRLNLDLHYRISQGKLNAENSVVVEQLQLGEKVDSPSAVDLPIRLAVALLKDTEGKIALSLPVQGDLNNPEFSVMPIVWKTLRNLILRAAQAPFKFIGGLVSGGAEMDLSTVHFNPGSSELDSSAQSALDLLASALKERPALRLEVEGISAQSSDGPLLAEQRLQREYQNTYHKILQRRGDAVPAVAKQLEVPEDEKDPLLEGIYRARLKQQPPAEWQELDKEQRAANLRAAILQLWGKSQMLQRRLAQARASSIKDYLVERGGLADERIYLLDVGLGQAQADGRVATALHLDSE
jgi:outer membrane protein OmpA-like peptidoglycan-associated protein